MKAWIGPAAALSFLLPLAHGAEFRMGQSVMVVPEEISLYMDSEVVATAQQGERLIVMKVQDDHVLVMSKGKKGWVRSDQLRVPPRPAPRPRPTPKTVERPAKEPVERPAEKPTERPAEDPEPARPRTVTLSGWFTWGKRPQKHDLRGVFTKTGSNRYDVAWHFRWGNKPQLYRGTMAGDFRRGRVQGQAGSGGRTWTFEGTARNGTLSCKHYETTGGKRNFSGEFLIRP